MLTYVDWKISIPSQLQHKTRRLKDVGFSMEGGRGVGTLALKDFQLHSVII